MQQNEIEKDIIPIQQVPALEKTFQILDCITAHTTAMNAAQIAKHLGMARSSVHTILQTLMQKGVVYKDAQNLFYMGSYVLYWAGKYEQQQRVIGVFHELIRQQPELLAHTITLSTLDRQKGEVVFLACHESPLPLGFTFRAGVRVPAIFAATGKAMLATLSSEEVKHIYAHGLPAAMTPFSVQNFQQLEQEFQHIRQTRISLDNGQLREGMYCLGTYIRDATGQAIAGMAISFVREEYEQKQQQVSQALIKFAQQIEKRLGSRL